MGGVPPFCILTFPPFLTVIAATDAYSSLVGSTKDTSSDCIPCNAFLFFAVSAARANLASSP